MSAFADRLKEAHRNLRPQRGEELSMRQVAYFFGGLYAIIHMLQYFDLWTLLIFAMIGYVVYRQIQNTMQLVSSAGEETTAQQQPAPNTKKAKAAKKASSGSA